MVSEFERLRALQGIDMRLDAVAASLYSDRSDGELALSLMAAAGETDGRLSAAGQLDQTFGQGGRAMASFYRSADIATASALLARGRIVVVGGHNFDSGFPVIDF